MGNIDHPEHYNHFGIECIDVVENFSFNLGSAIKYIWRARHKGNYVEDLKKAIWYLRREIENENRRNNRAREDTNTKKDLTKLEDRVRDLY